MGPEIVKAVKAILRLLSTCLGAERWNSLGGETEGDAGREAWLEGEVRSEVSLGGEVGREASLGLSSLSPPLTFRVGPGSQWESRFVAAIKQG